MSQTAWLDLLVIVTGSVVLLFALWRMLIKHRQVFFGLFITTPIFIAYATLDLLKQLDIISAGLAVVMGIPLLICLIIYGLYLTQFLRRNREISNTKKDYLNERN